MTTKRICGTVILYNPTEEEILNIYSYVKYLKKLWIIDNSEYDLREYGHYFVDFNNVEIIQDGCNTGIGNRLNFAIQKAREAKYDWILTMDQDSSFTNINLNRYIEIINSTDDQSNIAMIGINYSHNLVDTDNKTFLKPAMSVITSGAFVNLHSIKAIGMMNESLFIDEVDTEFSYRAVVKGWQIMICEGVQMKHHLGRRVTGRSVKTFKKTTRNIHSPVRLYYMIRNFLWVKMQYEEYFPLMFKLRKRQLLATFKNNLLYNPERISVFKMILKGYKDFKNGKMGKLIQ